MNHERFLFWKRLKTEQRLSVIFFGICGLLTIVLSVVQLRRSIIFPFTTSVDDLSAVQGLFGPTEEELEEEARRTDDDGDGISNWNEEQVFHTSPYLADTDSDGVMDNTEIAKGTDPNCPEGEECAYSLMIGESGSSAFSNVKPSNGSAIPLVPERNPEAIRAFLRAQGVSEADLSDYSDELLLEAYDQSSAVFEASQNTATSTADEPGGAVTEPETQDTL